MLSMSGTGCSNSYIDAARRMHVRIDQSRQHGLAAEIDLLGAGSGELHDLVVRADGDDAAVANRHGLDDAKLRIDGHDLAVDGRCGSAAASRCAAGSGDEGQNKQEELTCHVIACTVCRVASQLAQNSE